MRQVLLPTSMHRGEHEALMGKPSPHTFLPSGPFIYSAFEPLVLVGNQAAQRLLQPKKCVSIVKTLVLKNPSKCWVPGWALVATVTCLVPFLSWNSGLATWPWSSLGAANWSLQWGQELPQPSLVGQTCLGVSSQAWSPEVQTLCLSYLHIFSCMLTCLLHTKGSQESESFRLCVSPVLEVGLFINKRVLFGSQF
jgi:hypothetical protein